MSGIARRQFIRTELPPAAETLDLRNAPLSMPAARRYAAAVLAPFLLLLFSTVSAVAVAYGTDARWGTLRHGLAFIVGTRRLQWPLVALSVVLCVALLMMVVAGRRRVWWLVGLLPVLTLFAHRFLTRPDLQRQPVEDPPLVEASAASKILNTGDWVIGIHFAGRAIAFPFAQMYRAPAVLLRDREQRMILMWSPGANKATAFKIGRELHARDLEVVSFPAEALLLYDARLGTFVNAVTAETTTRSKPVSFGDPMTVEKLTWDEWLTQNPTTAVMDLPGVNRESVTRYDPTAHPVAGAKLTAICLVPPVTLSADDVPDAPVNLLENGASILLLRDPADGRLHAFDRHVESDLTPRFRAVSDPKHAAVVMTDADTGTEWSAGAAAVTGPAQTRGKTLTELPIETDLSADVMKFWYPQLQRIDRAQMLAGVQPAPAPPSANPAPGSPGGPTRHRHRRRSGNR